MGVFAAIAETAEPLPATETGRHWIARAVPRARLHELTGIQKPQTLRAKIRDLEGWGFIREVRRRQAPSNFELLPTGLSPLDHDTPLEPPTESQETPVLQVAPTPHQGRTNDPRVSENGALSNRTNDPRVSENGALSSLIDLDIRTAGAVHQNRTKTAPKPHQEDCRCAEAHPPFVSHKNYLTLKKANKRRFVDAAITEVAFRLGNPGATPEVKDPYTMVRNIAECYSGRCRTSHGNLHGENAMIYHRGRRADVEQLLRARQGQGGDPNPSLLSPLGEMPENLSQFLLDDDQDSQYQ